jgi:hypothetical protein
LRLQSLFGNISPRERLASSGINPRETNLVRTSGRWDICASRVGTSWLTSCSFINHLPASLHLSWAVLKPATLLGSSTRKNYPDILLRSPLGTMPSETASLDCSDKGFSNEEKQIGSESAMSGPEIVSPGQEVLAVLDLDPALNKKMHLVNDVSGHLSSYNCCPVISLADSRTGPG